MAKIRKRDALILTRRYSTKFDDLMNRVKAKKGLGQHFLKNKEIAERIVNSFSAEGCDSVMEIGPGMGILTGFLIKRNFNDFRVIEIDNESVHYLETDFPEIKSIIRGDFLRLDIETLFPGKVGIIGNFPYNISTQILFKVLDNKDKVAELTGMFQKEVAERICSGPGSRTYGILSVLLQAYYEIEYLFTVSADVFSPPPKVKSAVVRMVRNETLKLRCDEVLYKKVVKACFNQRRKTLRNSVRAVFRLKSEDYPLFHLRPEQLSVEQFVDLTNWIEGNREQ
jgi:16S rRNA (adenine1518-N6/adenine1519-N6)-dimethyltransferase